MIKIFQLIYHFTAFLALCFALYTGYDSFIKNKNPQLQITQIYAMKKSDTNNSNLYEVRYRIQNIGTQSILSQTNHQNLLDDKLEIKITNIKDFSRATFITNFKYEDIDFIYDGISIKFKQWMKNDYLDIIYLYEPIDKNKSVDIFIDKYQLINGEIKYNLKLYDDTPIIFIKE